MKLWHTLKIRLKWGSTLFALMKNKELPWFKFRVSDWISGKITLEKLDVQGLFINICSLYWQRAGRLTLTETKRRLSNAKATAFNSLINNGLIKVESDYLTISFLDIQLSDHENQSKSNSENGKRGGRPKKATALFSLSEDKANIKPIREEKRREDKTREEKTDISRELISNVSLLLKRKPNIKNESDQDVKYMLMQWEAAGFTNIPGQLKAMQAYYQLKEFKFPFKIETITTSFQEADWIQKLIDENPERIAENIYKEQKNANRKEPEPDTIGTSAPGSLG